MRRRRKENENAKWTVQDLGRLLKECALSIYRGKFLLQLNVERYLIHIVFVFFLFAMAIRFSLHVDKTLARVETNRHRIEELEIQHASLEFELKELDRRAEVISLLKSKGSEVGEPVKPAVILK